MRTDTLSIPFWSAEEVEAALRQALAHIEARGVLAYPTETVYGFGGGIDRDSVDALVALKTRPPAKPFFAAHRRRADDRQARSATAELRVQPSGATLAWPADARVGRRRTPRSRPPARTGRWCRGAMDAPSWDDALDSRTRRRHHLHQRQSAGGSPATSAAEILSQWGDAVARGKLRVLDGGTLVPSQPSTVLDCTGRWPRVIRPGAISANTLRESVPNLIGDA